MRELDFLPAWYPHLQQRRRSLSKRAWASAALAGGLASVAIGLWVDAWPSSRALSILTMASIMAGACWFAMLLRLKGLTVATAGADFSPMAPPAPPRPSANNAPPSDPFAPVLADLRNVTGITNLQCNRGERDSIQMQFDADMRAVTELLHRLQQLGQRFFVSELNVNGGGGAEPLRVRMEIGLANDR